MQSAYPHRHLLPLGVLVRQRLAINCSLFLISLTVERLSLSYVVDGINEYSDPFDHEEPPD